MNHSSQFLLSGEFHYFRVKKSLWRDRLLQMHDMGLNTVSIYIPWNWHEPTRGVLDFTGKTVPERDLLGALDAIAASGMDCIFRPGPFITAEWRNGAIPDWLIGDHPEILVVDAQGKPANTDIPYPAITYDHPIFRSASKKWLECLFGPVSPYLASSGGPIKNIQVEDETSYWHLLDKPLMADFNPVLVESQPGGSMYAKWLLQRHGSLDRINALHGTQFQKLEDFDPPREYISTRGEFQRHRDWLEFKLSRINEYIGFLVDVLRNRGVDGPLSMLYPYLRSSIAIKFSDFLNDRKLDLELTNECYTTLLTSSSFPEYKIGHIVSTHETYHMWRENAPGSPVSMELQASNAAFLTPGAMEILYAITLARGIKGINFYMLVGGENPRGYENITGRDYDICAAVSPLGEERPHAAVIRKLSKIIRACQPEVLNTQPLRDVWLGCYGPYEMAGLVGSDSVMADAGALMDQFFSLGTNGLSEAMSLPSLLALSSISYGCLDLEKISQVRLNDVKQLWIYCLDYLSRDVQNKLSIYLQNGGHLVMMPCIPTLDEKMEPCNLLMRSIFPEKPPVSFWKTFAMMRSFTHILSQEDESMISMGKASTFQLPEGAIPLAYSQADSLPCAFDLPVGSGLVTVLGFPLQYVPAASSSQKDFVARIVEKRSLKRKVTTSNQQFAAMEMADDQSGFICVINPVNIPGMTRVSFTEPGSSQILDIPLHMNAIQFSGQGALLLPVFVRLNEQLVLQHATWELIGRATNSAGVLLEFSTISNQLGEVALLGNAASIEVAGGKILEKVLLNETLTVITLLSKENEVSLQINTK